MKRVICLILSVLMIAALLCGCSSYEKRVAGTWRYKLYRPTEDVEELLRDSNELYDAEIALVDTPMYLVKTLVLNEDLTYTYSYPIEECKAEVRRFYDGVFMDLYAGKDTLKDCYDTDISTLSEEDFKLFYAGLYGADTYDALLDKLTDAAFDYEAMENFESGTYTINAKMLSMDTEGTEDDGTVKYELNEGWLVLTYEDTTESYTRIN